MNIYCVLGAEKVAVPPSSDEFWPPQMFSPQEQLLVGG